MTNPACQLTGFVCFDQAFVRSASAVSYAQHKCVLSGSRRSPPVPEDSGSELWRLWVRAAVPRPGDWRAGVLTQGSVS